MLHQLPIGLKNVPAPSRMSEVLGDVCWVPPELGLERTRRGLGTPRNFIELRRLIIMKTRRRRKIYQPPSPTHQDENKSLRVYFKFPYAAGGLQERRRWEVASS